MKLLLYYFLIIIPLIFVSSCFTSYGRNLDDRDQYLYNKTGFDPGERPGEPPSQRRNATQQIVPDYYYRAAPNPRQTSVSQQVPPASRYYSNPYSFTPPTAFPFYDSDQYYTPPQGGRHQGEEYPREGPTY